MSANFFDSNVLVYQLDDSHPDKRDIAQDLIDRAFAENDTAISFQVVQESLNVVTQKWRNPVSSDKAERFLRETLMPLCEVYPHEGLYLEGLAIKSRYKYRFYDSLIIAAALELGCQTLYSEDMQDGQVIEETLTIVNPFK